MPPRASWSLPVGELGLTEYIKPRPTGIGGPGSPGVGRLWGNSSRPPGHARMTQMRRQRSSAKPTPDRQLCHAIKKGAAESLLRFRAFQSRSESKLNFRRLALSAFRWDDLTADFAAWVGLGMDIDVPLAGGKLLRLFGRERRLPLDRVFRGAALLAHPHH
jgi:hypothetical protein